MAALSKHEWLGDLPAHWKVVPAWSLYRRVKRTGHASEELLSVYRDYGVIPKSSRDDNHNVESEDLSSYQLVKTGDLVMNKMKAWQGSIALSAYQGIVSPAYFVFQPLHTGNLRYFHYLLRSQQYIGAYNRISKGVRVGQWDLDPTHFRTLPVPVPPVEEQKAIADFLDREVTQIDLLIEKQNQLVATLQERLDAEVREKTFANVGGLAGFGFRVDATSRLPERWIMGQLAHLVSLSSGNSIDSAFIEPEGSFPVFGANGFRGFTETSNLNKEVLLVGRVGALCGNVHHISGAAWVTEHALIAEPRKAFNFSWLRHTLRAMNLGKYATSTAQPVIAAGVISKLRLPVPPLADQVALGEELDSEERKVERLVALAVEVSNALLERRKAIINDATTGKIDVQGKN